MKRDAMLHAAARFRGWAYGGLDEARERVDCCAFAALVVREAYGLEVEVSWSDAWWRDCMVGDAAAPWSGPAAMAEATGGYHRIPRAGPERPEAGRWHYVQGWQSLSGPGRAVGPGDRGHTLLWLSTVGDPWVGWTLESHFQGGPVVGTADGWVPLGDAVTALGDVIAPLRPMAWSDRMSRYAAGTSWCVLPEVT